MNTSYRTGLLGLASALALSLPASATSLESAAGAQAIAVVNGGGSGGSSGGRIQGLATTPDAIAPSSSSAIGARSCYVPASSDAVSAVFVSYGGARWMLDEGCEARADAEAFVGIAYARMELFGDARGALRNLDIAERRMTAVRAKFIAASGDQPWPEFWRP